MFSRRGPGLRRARRTTQDLMILQESVRRLDAAGTRSRDIMRMLNIDKHLLYELRHYDVGSERVNWENGPKKQLMILRSVYRQTWNEISSNLKTMFSMPGLTGTKAKTMFYHLRKNGFVEQIHDDLEAEWGRVLWMTTLNFL